MDGNKLDYETIDEAVRPAGLMNRGGFHHQPGDELPPGTATVILIGNAGSDMWQHFSTSAEAINPNLTDPLDTWTRRVVDAIAKRFDATTVYPFDGPPYPPFQTWAMHAEAVIQSPVGPLIHPDYGLWHAYRAALCFSVALDLPSQPDTPAPCRSCEDKPCLTSCPADVFRNGGYDVAACTGHIAGEDRAGCMSAGCAARRACPVGAKYTHGPAQARFHMEKFLQSHR